MSYDVELTEVGSGVLRIIMIVREETGLGLKETKDLVESVPQLLKKGVSEAEAEALKARLEEAGAKVTLK